MASNHVEMSVGKQVVNGDHVNHDTVSPQTQKLTSTNGESKLPSKPSMNQNGEAGPVLPRSPYINGAASSASQSLSLHNDTTEPLPQELLEVLNSVPIDSFVPMAPLISRSAQLCWMDLKGLIDQLSNIRLPPLRPDQDRLANGNINDNSIQNREKKMLIWDYAKRHKDIFVKLLVLLQSSKKSEEVRRTIALNFWLHNMRRAFNDSTLILGNTLRDLVRAQIPNPDLETAAEVLATGKVSSFSTLGYLPEPELTSQQILKVLRRLDTVLCARMTAESNVPEQMNSWSVHDGRVTFKVAKEFELDLSVISEDPKANFGVVAVRFDFSPAPEIPGPLQDEIARRVNSEMEREGFLGAYKILHELTLSHKLQTLRKQAADLIQGQWAGHLQIEMHRRTLVIQYWPRRPGPKNWIEIGIASGKRQSSNGTISRSDSCLQLLWTRSGRRIDNHDILIDLAHLDLEQILHQVVAQHINDLLGTIYDKILTIPIYDRAELEIGQVTSLIEPRECKLSLQTSIGEEIGIFIESIGGTLTITPANERTARLQYELSRSKSITEDAFVKLMALRYAMTETKILRCIAHNGWQHLPGLRPSLTEAKDLFGNSTARVSLFRYQNWMEDWSLALTLGSEGDIWWIVYQASGSPIKVAERLNTIPLHLEIELNRQYFEKLASYASTIIILQTYAKSLKSLNIATALPDPGSLSNFNKIPKLTIHLDSSHQFTYLYRTITMTPSKNNEDLDGSTLITAAWFPPQPGLSQMLSTTKFGDFIRIDATAGGVTLMTKGKVGEVRTSDILSDLRKVDDLLSCADLVQKSKSWILRSVSLQFIELVYFQSENMNLSLKLNLDKRPEGIGIDLLPLESNPHNIIASHVSHVLNSGEGSLKLRLQRLLTVLHMSLPLVRALQYLQTDQSALLVPDELKLNKSETSETLRAHIMARDTTRFAVHYFSTTDKFKRDLQNNETPKNLLARFEIVPRPGKDGTRLAWIVRPAMEEVHSYVRPSFASKNLERRLQEKVFENSEAKGWLALDKAACCRTVEPYTLLSTIHNVILEWLKENMDSTSESIEVKTKATAQVNGTKSGAAASSKSNTSTQPVQSGRVMTAPPQQVRAGLNAPQQQQRGNMQQNQQRNNKSNNREVILLD